jgi:hypothetical protein
VRLGFEQKQKRKIKGVAKLPLAICKFVGVFSPISGGGQTTRIWPRGSWISNFFLLLFYNNFKFFLKIKNYKRFFFFFVIKRIPNIFLNLINSLSGTLTIE